MRPVRRRCTPVRPVRRRCTSSDDAHKRPGLVLRAARRGGGERKEALKDGMGKALAGGARTCAVEWQLASCGSGTRQQAATMISESGTGRSQSCRSCRGWLPRKKECPREAPSRRASNSRTRRAHPEQSSRRIARRPVCAGQILHWPPSGASALRVQAQRGILALRLRGRGV